MQGGGNSRPGVRATLPPALPRINMQQLGAQRQASESSRLLAVDIVGQRHVSGN
eukprot:gene20865-biopygen16146